MKTSKHYTTVFPGAMVLLAIFGFAIFISMFSAPVNVSAEEKIVVADGSHETPLQPSATFPANAGTLGAIPDGTVAGCNNYGTSTPKNVTFTVSGISGVITDVRLSTTFSPAHTWRGDLSLELIAPGGAPSKIILRHTGSTTATGCGSANDAAGPYVFRDTASANWWANPSSPTTAGDYQASTPGGVVGGGANTTITTPFTILGNAANGTWTLRILDGGQGDTGTISDASLTITATGPVNAPHDVNGDGRSDFTVIRADVTSSQLALSGVNDYSGKDKVGNMQKLTESESPNAGVSWYSASSTGTYLGRQVFGLDIDFFMIADMVGDNKDDLVVWRPATLANFYILDSGNFTVTNRQFGTTGDDPTVLGDFNGDGKDDLVVYRDGTGISPQSYFYWASVTAPAGSFTTVPWGTDGDIGFTLDHDGDGKADPAIQRNGGGGAGVFYVRQSTQGPFAFFWGLSSDFVVPGDYDGDGRDDMCVSRNANFGTGTYKYFFIRPSDGGSPIYQQWGVPGDSITQGDYDGDGRTDIGIWRASSTPGATSFFVKISSGSFRSFAWGKTGDYPANNWNVH